MLGEYRFKIVFRVRPCECRADRRVGQACLTEDSAPGTGEPSRRQCRGVTTVLLVEGDDRVRFELDRLASHHYEDADILAEVQRVAALESGPLTRTAFDRLSRVNSSTCVKRFGGWGRTLKAAGLEHRDFGKRVSQKMREQTAKTLTDEEIIEELRRVAAELGQITLTQAEITQRSPLLGQFVVRKRFGSWQAALAAAGLEPTRLGRRYTEDDYFENLLAVWTFYGRAPRYGEMDRAPSRISSGAHERRFGSWGKAKVAFVERVNRDLPDAGPDALDSAATPVAPSPLQNVSELDTAFRRAIPLGLRYKVLRRDSFRCVTCGRSPATELECVLHIDHVQPFSKGGATAFDNLRTLCEKCNVGKGDRPA